MLFSASLFLASAASTVSALPLNSLQSRDTCTQLCPPYDGDGNVLEYVVGPQWDGDTNIECYYDYAIPPASEWPGATSPAYLTVCEYNTVSGELTWASVNNQTPCPTQAVVVYSCPPYDTAGEPLNYTSNTYSQIGCYYDVYVTDAAGDEMVGTDCGYDPVNGVLNGGYGNCPSTAAC